MTDEELLKYLAGLARNNPGVLPLSMVYGDCLSMVVRRTGKDESTCRKLYGKFTVKQWLDVLAE